MDEQVRKNRELGRADNEPTDSDFDSTMPPAKQMRLVFGVDLESWPAWFAIGLVLALGAYLFFAVGGWR